MNSRQRNAIIITVGHNETRKKTKHFKICVCNVNFNYAPIRDPLQKFNPPANLCSVSKTLNHRWKEEKIHESNSTVTKELCCNPSQIKRRNPVTIGLASKRSTSIDSI